MIQNGRTARLTDSESVTELLSGIRSDGQTLLQQQVALLRTEIKEAMQRGTSASMLLAVGMLLISTGSILIGTGLVYGLQWIAPNMPFGACWAVVGGVAFIIGFGVFVTAKRQLTSISPFPDKTLNALSENLTWIRNQASSSSVT